jgi:hypothetical protein
MVKASGIAHSLAEIGEQFSWLGAALRSSKFSAGVALCIPTLWAISPGSYEKRYNSKLYRSKCDGFCEIKFSMHPTESPKENLIGRCWHRLFHNPVLVEGFPIPKRSVAHTGLEIPLNMVAELTQTWRINPFAGEIFVKGFSTMLVPVKQNCDILVWHLLYNEDGSRISYLDYNGQFEGCLKVDEIDKFRHVVGWCSDVRYYAGETVLRCNTNI